MGLYERIRDVAKNRGYSINQLEKELGFARSSIYKFNKNTPSTEKMQRIADFFNVTIDYFVSPSDTSTHIEIDEAANDTTYKIYCELRDARRLKDIDIAKATQIPKSTFSDWKSGRSKPKNEKLRKIALFFDVPLSYFIDGTAFQDDLESDVIMNLKERVKELCKRNSKSMNQVEKDLNFGRGYISKLDQSVPNMNKIQQLADYFNVSVDYVLTGSTTHKFHEKLLNDSQTVHMIHEYYSLNTQTQSIIQQLIHEMYQMQCGTNDSMT